MPRIMAWWNNQISAAFLDKCPHLVRLQHFSDRRYLFIFTNGTSVGERYFELFDQHRNLIPIVSIEGIRNHGFPARQWDL